MTSSVSMLLRQPSAFRAMAALTVSLLMASSSPPELKRSVRFSSRLSCLVVEGALAEEDVELLELELSEEPLEPELELSEEPLEPELELSEESSAALSKREEPFWEALPSGSSQVELP